MGPTDWLIAAGIGLAGALALGAASVSACNAGDSAFASLCVTSNGFAGAGLAPTLLSTRTVSYVCAEPMTNDVPASP
jgi:hypothetical protein